MDASFTGLLNFGAQDMLTTAGAPVTLAHRRGGLSPTTAVVSVQSGDMSALLQGERVTVLAHAILPLSVKPLPGDTLVTPDGVRWTVESVLASPPESVYRCELSAHA